MREVCCISFHVIPIKLFRGGIVSLLTYCTPTVFGGLESRIRIGQGTEIAPSLWLGEVFSYYRCWVCMSMTNGTMHIHMVTQKSANKGTAVMKTGPDLTRRL